MRILLDGEYFGYGRIEDIAEISGLDESRFSYDEGDLKKEKIGHLQEEALSDTRGLFTPGKEIEEFLGVLAMEIGNIHSKLNTEISSQSEESPFVDSRTEKIIQRFHRLSEDINKIEKGEE